MSATVSVVIPTHQRPRYLGRAIQSVLDQTGAECEIVIVDDNGAGTEHQLETLKLIQSYGADSPIRYVIQPHNQGGGAARNAGIKNSTGEYIGFLDDDDEWRPEFARKHLDVFARSSADIVYCGYQYVHDDDNKEHSGVAEYHRGIVFGHLLKGWCPVSTSLFMVRASVFRDKKAFDERLPSFQDLDCWLNLAKNHEFDYCEDELLLKHGHGAGQISVNPVTRKAGLSILERKWRERLSVQEWAVFQATLTHHKKEVIRKELLLARQSRDIVAAARHAVRFLTFEPPKLREIARVGKHLLFPYR